VVKPKDYEAGIGCFTTKHTANPAWNCTMVFDDVTVENLKEKSLELTIWDYDK
jgi:synaptotagmin-like protein